MFISLSMSQAREVTTPRQPPAKRAAGAAKPASAAPAQAKAAAAAPATRRTTRRATTATTRRPATRRPPAAKPANEAIAKGDVTTAALQGNIRDFESAWAAKHPPADVWTPQPWVPTDRVADRRPSRTQACATQQPRRVRAQVGRDPIAILEAQEEGPPAGPGAAAPRAHGRIALRLLPRHAGGHGFDLADTPSTEILVQASGDAHLSNFGIYASPERHIVFDANDFDETLPAPWEWDVKRLAASVIIAGRANGFSRSQSRLPPWRP
jgi:hypothetical protein